jgi:hypothetical protein
MSAFDSLLDSNKPKPSMSQMAATGTSQMGSNQMAGGMMRPGGFNQPMGMAVQNPQAGFGMSPQNSMGMGMSPQGMGMGMGSPMGSQQGLGMSPGPQMGSPMMVGGQAGFGQMGMMQGHNPAFANQVLSPTGSTPGSHKSSTNSLDDLLG